MFIHYCLNKHPQPEQVEVAVQRVDKATMGEMWSFVGKKKQQRWLWHASDHVSEKVLAYVLAPHTDAALQVLMSCLVPFGFKRFYTVA